MYVISPMDLNAACHIAKWEYEDIYAVYSFKENEETIKELLNGDYYMAHNNQNEIIGYYCFGKSAQIPVKQTEAYTSCFLDIGFGMRPDLCGKGLGYDFLKSGIEYSINHFNAKKYRLTVATFNKRAIALYNKIGFKKVNTVQHLISNNKFEIMVLQE
ncbi:GNAT family N-acetyltransferase [Mobilitalea sibirica]|uniref:GNAT family N-acetyltransferase n=1 Tax=Mobilitalea sibirica TaxID=1462919 RepID=A0A8J7L305_9FIRM|nr:GNAT family N-acetyltransferase [Mobilitalea sibirica]MBH1941543.1 GNAT family N-acetyltransferase [Mobilitalea sibirica]